MRRAVILVAAAGLAVAFACGGLTSSGGRHGDAGGEDGPLGADEGAADSGPESSKRPVVCDPCRGTEDSGFDSGHWSVCDPGDICSGNGAGGCSFFCCQPAPGSDCK
jgi:hypothetical protein